MKGTTGTYPYEPLEGLNPFMEELKSAGKQLEYQAKQIEATAALHAYFVRFPEVASDDIKSIRVLSDSVTFNLAVKNSRFVHALAQFTGLSFEKLMGWDKESLTLDSKIPKGHPLHAMGITLLSVTGYLPDTCKVVVKEHKPLSDEQRETYQRLLDEGYPVYETYCEPETIDMKQHVDEEFSNVLGG